MTRLKRLCPDCGSANALERETCFSCGAEITADLAPIGESAPVPWKKVGTRIAVGAGILALRAGVYLVQRYLEQRAERYADAGSRSEGSAKPVRAGRRAVTQAPQTRVTMWGRRARGRRDRSGITDLEVEEVYYRTEAD